MGHQNLRVEGLWIFQGHKNVNVLLCGKSQLYPRSNRKKEFGLLKGVLHTTGFCFIGDHQKNFFKGFNFVKIFQR